MLLRGLLLLLGVLAVFLFGEVVTVFSLGASAVISELQTGRCIQVVRATCMYACCQFMKAKRGYPSGGTCSHRHCMW